MRLANGSKLRASAPRRILLVFALLLALAPTVVTEVTNHTPLARADTQCVWNLEASSSNQYVLVKLWHYPCNGNHYIHTETIAATLQYWPVCSGLYKNNVLEGEVCSNTSNDVNSGNDSTCVSTDYIGAGEAGNTPISYTPNWICGSV